ncbi:MAG: hypothetical protein Q8O67_20415 [Deltaproteobacteria bacterium]|nr:hypothetical protein [Deltaproteobacteria bacterium]
MKSLPPDQQRALGAVADDAVRGLTPAIVLTPWVTALPGWGFIGRRPLARSAGAGVVVFVVVLACLQGPLTPHLVIRTAVAAVGLVLGFYGIFFLAGRLTAIHGVLKFLTLLPADVMSRWFVESIVPLLGSVNLLPVEERKSVGLARLWYRDRPVLLSYVFWVVVASTFVVFATRLLPLKGPVTLEWCALVGYDVVWCLSFLWTGYLIPQLLVFIVRVGRLPVHTFFAMPDSLSLRALGGVFVTLAWCGSLHLWFVLLPLATWDVLGAHPAEPVQTTAFITFATIGFAALYLLELVLMTVGTQVVLSRAMMAFRDKRQAEHAFHLEKLFDVYTRQPTAAGFKELEDRHSEGQAILRRLPRFSLSKGALASFVVMLILDGLALWVFVASSLDVDRLGELWRALMA